MEMKYKEIELVSNIPIPSKGLDSKGLCLQYKLCLADENKMIDLKSLKVENVKPKAFQRMDIWYYDKINESQNIYDCVYPEAVGNISNSKSFGLNLIGSDFMVRANRTLEIRFIRNNDEYDISDMKVKISIFTDSKMENKIPRSKMLVCPIWNGKKMQINLDCTDDKVKHLTLLNMSVYAKKSIQFLGDFMKIGIRIENQMNDELCNSLQIGEWVDIDGKNQLFNVDLTLSNEDEFDGCIYIYYWLDDI